MEIDPVVVLAEELRATEMALRTAEFFERAQRQIPIYYARRTVGRRVYGGQTAHLVGSRTRCQGSADARGKRQG